MRRRGHIALTHMVKPTKLLKSKSMKKKASLFLSLLSPFLSPCSISLKSTTERKEQGHPLQIHTHVVNCSLCEANNYLLSVYIYTYLYIVIYTLAWNRVWGLKMPRPGPRPYECVRRAWHSDRHQPMRGLIIQQIFRVVHESHGSVTKKNKEWQDKLPIVVLKAEEIIYSKANSEAEYMDLETLWDRVNDAVNTIIRKDESTETGELLPPCIEAALNLGCFPVRASRSQRNNNPRAYLRSRTPEPGFAHPPNSDNMTNGNRLAFSRQPVTPNSTHLVSEPNRPVTPNHNPTASCNFPLSYEKTPTGNVQIIPKKESNFPLNVGSVYPLYYGTDFQLEVQTPKDSSTIILGRPLFFSSVERAEVGSLRSLFPCDTDENASNRTIQPHFGDNRGNENGAECDLSLRLGVGKCLTRQNDDVCSISRLFPLKNREFPFSPMRSSNDSSEFCASKLNHESEVQNTEAAIRKRKAPFSNKVEDGKFFWVPEPNFNQFNGKMKKPGL